MLRRWRELLASLGESLLEVAEAEVTALKVDLRASGRDFGIAIGLLLAAAVLVFWVVGAVGWVLYQVALIWLPGWGAALIVLGVLVMVALVLIAAGKRRLSRLEAPVDTVRRRVEDHKEWWQNNLLADVSADEPTQIADGQESERPDS